MLDWLNSLEPSLRIYWWIAIIASLIFIIQTVISLVGGGVFDDVSDVDTDFDADSHSGGVSHFFSIRNLVNFMLGTGWSGICFYKTIPSKLLLMFVAIFCGIFFLFIFFFLVKILLKLSKDNTFHLNETLDKIADVYLFIPANESGKGKIQISVRGSVHEIDALTKGERISTDEKVRVIQIIGNQAILV